MPSPTSLIRNRGDREKRFGRAAPLRAQHGAGGYDIRHPIDDQHKLSTQTRPPFATATGAAHDARELS